MYVSSEDIDPQYFEYVHKLKILRTYLLMMYALYELILYDSLLVLFGDMTSIFSN